MSNDHTATDRPTMRIDGAHVRSIKDIRDAPLMEEAEMLAIAGEESSLFSEQLQRQARELGGHLQAQQFELDQRESEFNARAAQLENEFRTSRLIQQEREIEMHQRESEFSEQWDKLQQQAADVTEAQLALNAETHERKLDHHTDAEHAKHARKRWEQRLRELDESEKQLQTQLADMAHEHQRLDEERAQLKQEREQLRKQLSSECETARQRLNQRLSRLQQRSEQLERRRLTVQQLHSDVTRMYREAMEMRLCTEELWGELTRSVSPATLTQKLSKLRSKLAEQFQLASQSLTDQKAEIQELVERLEQHRIHVQEKREKLQRWLVRRHAEIEHQAARLVVREQQLDQQQASVDHLKRDWERRQTEYKEEIHQLRRQLTREAGSQAQMSIS